jgi:hypothetical protein
MTMPKKRLISGILETQLAQLGKEVFGFLTSNLEIDCVWADVNFLAPPNLTTRANVDLLKFSVIIPERKNPLTDEIGQINRSFDAI